MVQGVFRYNNKDIPSNRALEELNNRLANQSKEIENNWETLMEIADHNVFSINIQAHNSVQSIVERYQQYLKGQSQENDPQDSGDPGGSLQHQKKQKQVKQVKFQTDESIQATKDRKKRRKKPRKSPTQRSVDEVLDAAWQACNEQYKWGRGKNPDKPKSVTRGPTVDIPSNLFKHVIQALQNYEGVRMYGGAVHVFEWTTGWHFNIQARPGKKDPGTRCIIHLQRL